MKQYLTIEAADRKMKSKAANIKGKRKERQEDRKCISQ